jgi:DNA primase
LRSGGALIPDDKISEIRERTDIVALIGDFVPLKRAGASFRGLCPFHPEKSPSFYVHPARQFFHCFGCRASGDAFAFLMRMEGRAFPEVARTLAERAGVELPVVDAADDARHRRERQRMDRLASLMEAAAGFYVEQLHAHPLARMARDELDRRGIGADAAQRFRLGYAPHGWDALVRFVQQRGYSPQEAEEMGLLVPRRSGSGHYDRFRHRLMFPVADLHGRIVAFSGRQLDPPPGEEPRGDAPAKYVNSPEGPLYKKGDILFGLHEGRVDVRREGWVLVCEGNFDLVALHQAGFPNAVAPMGTALTATHAKLIRRFAERVVLLFDGDRAGRRAVHSAFPVLQGEGLASRVVVLPSGSDPDTFLRAEGADALRRKIDAAPGALEFVIDDAAAETAGEPQRRGEAIGELAPLLATVRNEVERRIYVERVARRFEVHDVDLVRRALRQGLQTARQGRPGDDASRRARVKPDDAPHQARQTATFPPLEAELLGAVLDDPELVRSEEGEKLDDLLTSPDLRAIFQATCRMVETRGAVDGQALVAEVATSSACQWLEQRLVKPIHVPDEAREVLRKGIPRLLRQRVQNELREVRDDILRARREGDDTRAETLLTRRVELERRARELASGGAAAKQGTER